MKKQLSIIVMIVYLIVLILSPFLFKDCNSNNNTNAEYAEYNEDLLKLSENFDRKNNALRRNTYGRNIYT